MINQLESYRKKINKIDEEIINLFLTRFQVSKKIGEEKKIIGEKVFIPEREKEILQNLKSKTQNPIIARGLEKIYQEIFSASREFQATCDQQFNYPISIGIIGHGNFGELLARTFKKFWGGANIKIFDINKKIDEQTFFKLEEVAQQELLFPCVPISIIPEILKSLKPIINPQTTIVDICSVKKYPIDSAKKNLPNIKLISTHPMFGPDSTFDGATFYNRKMAVCNISANEEIYEIYKNFWQNLGVVTIEMTPEKHDEISAFSQAYIHFVGKIGEKMGIKKTPIDTKSFSFFCKALTMMNSDSEELFKDIMTKNVYARNMRQQFQETLNQIESDLK
jgi:prephenate dehydrogenase/chorismate mutase